MYHQDGDTEGAAPLGSPTGLRPVVRYKLNYKYYRTRAKPYKALANERRIALLEFLADDSMPERYSVADLSRKFRIPYKLVSRHLLILDHAELVERVRRGQEIGYRVTPLGRKCFATTISG